MNSVQQKDLVAITVDLVNGFKSARISAEYLERSLIDLAFQYREYDAINIINQTLKTTKSGYRLTIKHSQGFPIYYLEKV